MTHRADIAVTLPVEGRFSYLIPEHLEGQLEVGHRVLVPFGRRRVTGFVLKTREPSPHDLPDSALKVIEARLDAAPIVPSSLLDLCQFAADYYLHPLGEVLKAALPPGFTGSSKLRYHLTNAGRLALKTQPSTYADGTSVKSDHWALMLAAQDKGLAPTQDVPCPQHAPGLFPDSSTPLRHLSRQAKAKGLVHLQSQGWIALKDSVSAKVGDGEVQVVRRLKPPPLAEPYLLNAPARQKLYYALANGPIELPKLQEQWGAPRLRRVLNRLVEDGVVEVIRQAATRPSETPSPHAYAPSPHALRPSLTEEQTKVLEPIVEALDARDAKTFLLHGVTGSGKTEVYLGVIERSLQAGRGAIVLVPEIALTPQLEARFRDRFGDEVVVLHSAIPDGERRRRWHRLQRGQARIAVGPRSSVWAPIDPLGALIVDEEHDGSFKQQTDLRYHGRDLALARARQAQAVTVLGSATPSLEALHLVDQGRITKLQLTQRVGGRPMPQVQLVDLREERRALGGKLPLISRPLEDELRELPARGEQGILFLNRRGFNTIVHCGACDEVRTCPSCDVSLTYHRSQHQLKCHYCGHEESFDTPCPSCGAQDVRPMGAGTERVVDAVQSISPDLRILRLDRDVVQKAGQMEAVLERFRQGEADLLVGTQMVAKGHDFPKVTLVGIVLADASLAFPDFRAAERTFQLVTQVAGRAGRAERPGKVVVQTLQPEHYALTCAINHDVKGFYEIEGPARQEALYPPYQRLGVIRAESLDLNQTLEAATHIAQTARSLMEGSLRVLGPAPAPIGRIKNRHRQMVLLFAPTPARLSVWMTRIKASLADTLRNVDLSYDVDAVDLI